jgi:PAS domain S-box-containing protein
MIKKPNHLQAPHNTRRTTNRKTKTPTGYYTLIQPLDEKLHSLSIDEHNLENLNLKDILDRQNIRPILRDMSRLTNTSVAIVDLSGKMVFATDWQDICTKFHRVHPDTLKNCLESDKSLHANVDDGTIQVCKCKNMLQDVSTPIFIGDKRLGSLIVGQFFFDDEEIDHDFFRSQAKKYQFDEKSYIAALNRVPRYNRNKIYELMSFYRRFINLISTLNINNTELAASLGERDILLNSLRQNENQYRLLVENVHEGILRIDKDTRILFVNEQMAKMLGYTVDEMLGKYLYLFINNKKRKTDRISMAAINKNIREQRDFEFIHKDGSKLYAMLSSTPVIDDKGKYEEAIIGVQDITERKIAEEALAEEATRRRILFEQSRDGIVVMDEKGKVYESNQQFADMLGYSMEEVYNLHVWDWDTQWSRKQLLEMIRTVDEKGDHFETYHRCKDGSTVDVEISSNGAFIGDKKYVLCVCRDITKRKVAERALQQSKNKLKSVFDTTPTGIGITVNHVFTELNNTFCEIIGYSKQELLSKDSRIIYESDEVYNDVGIRLDSLITRHGTGTIESRFRRKDGSVIDVLIKGTFTDYDDSVKARVFAVVDITEQKIMEKALRENAEQLENIINHLQTGIIIIEAETHKIVDVNPVAAELIGTSREKIIGQICQNFICPVHNNKCPITDLGQVMDRSERELIKNNGERIPILKSVTSFNYRGHEHLIENFIDMSERKRIEEERQRVEKLESIGLLAGGIAHDFNNILTGILGNISLAKISVDEDSDIFEIMQEAERASLKAKELTQQLLTFSRGGAPVMKTASIAEILKHTATFVVRGSNVRCDFSIPDDLWNAEIDEGQISQVINNLIINALQSMPAGGLIELIAENVDENDYRELDSGIPLKKTKYIKITVRDHGIGIPPDHLAKIFDPFFTTKQKGSGLGLATSYSIVRRHNGYINVSSRIGEGTTFYVYLPATENKTSIETIEKDEYAFADGRLLVMDDEEIVREVVKRTLNHMGYKNFDFAVDGEEVLSLYRKSYKEGNPYSLVILDLTVPGGMGGEETMRELLKMDPKINAIVSSGYSNEPVMSEYRKYGFKGAITKPYTIEQLQQALNLVPSGS